MIALRDVLVRPGILDSERVCALPLACQLFFRNLLHACDGAARFPADADELRAAFYWRSSGVSRPHVEAWLAKLHQARLVKLYTRDGKPYGELFNYGQRDTRRKVLYPPPEDGQLNFAQPADDPPEPERPRARSPEPPWLPSEQEMNRREGKRAERAKPAPAPIELQEDWIGRLVRAWPGVNVLAELEQAGKKKARAGEKLDRVWFEKSWLPNCGPAVEFASGRREARGERLEPEPEAWRVWLELEYPGNVYAKGGTHEDTTWASLPAEVRKKIATEMARSPSVT